jgi:phospholipase C
MRHSDFIHRLPSSAFVTASTLALVASQAAFADDDHRDRRETATPIKHVIIIIGENRTFDHIFATYEPVHKHEKVSNLLSKGIVKPDGSPGVNYSVALQYSASDTTTYLLSPTKTPYAALPPALVGGPTTPYGCQILSAATTGTPQTGVTCDSAANEAAIMPFENGLDGAYYKYLLTGGTGQTSKAHDVRVSYDGQGATTLPPGPYQLTNASYPYDAYAASPVHRFYQMWQQLDCSVANASKANSSGCVSDLFPWVEVSIGAGSNGKAQPAGFTDETTGEGSTAMGFFNVQQGDAPYLKHLADTYAMSDNYHQAVNGGTGANHVMLGTGDAIWFSDGAGNAIAPPNNGVDPNNPGTPLMGKTSALSEIEDPNPQTGTNNYYKQDGYGGGSGKFSATAPNANYGGGTFSDCADLSQPGVAPVVNYLNALKRKVPANCETGHYYMLNNYNPGYFGDGSDATADHNANNRVYTIPPSTLRTIGDTLNDKKISWAYYGDQFNLYLADKYGQNPVDTYCNICNWAQYATSIMTKPAEGAAHIKDTTDFYTSVASGDLPAVSYVKPSGLVDGHPSSSKLDLFEGFVKKIVDGVKGNPKLWDDTAIFVTFDEGGGYWDSGYVQPLDYFGDGTRIPMIVVSKFSEGGHISHSYTDHVSTLKFIEANWHLGPITSRSRDNLPNPKADDANPYVPVNSPAIGDMMDMFDFDHEHHGDHQE